MNSPALTLLALPVNQRLSLTHAPPHSSGQKLLLRPNVRKGSKGDILPVIADRLLLGSTRRPLNVGDWR